MNEAHCSDDLIEAFYRAYNATSGTHQDRLLESQAVLDRLRICAVDKQRFAPWCFLFEGILANEHQRDWGRGEQLFRAALDAAADDRLLRGRACLALAVTYHNLDRWQDSLAYCRQAAEALDGLAKPLDQAAALINVGVAINSGYRYGIFGSRDLAQGIDDCQRALAILATMDPSSRQRPSLEASAMTTLGNLHNMAGQWDDALAAYSRHLAICQEAGFTCRTGVSHNNLGEVYARMGPDHLELALQSLQEAYRIHRECRDDFRVLEAVQMLAEVARLAGDDEQALAYALESVGLAEIVRAGISLAEARAGFAATVATVYAQAILLAVHANRPRLAFDLVERSRSRAFLDSLTSGSSELVRNVEAGSIDLDQVQDRLAPDAVLLEYFTCGTLEGGALRSKSIRQSLQFYLPAPTTLLFAVTRDTVEMLDLDLSPVDVLPQRLTGAVERHFLQPAIRLALYHRLIHPIRHLLAGKRRITIVPHGPLHYVPFGALMDEDGQTLLHDGGPELVYGPSASVLFRDRSARPFGFPKTQRVLAASCLAIGYNGDAGNRLRYAEEEAESVAAMLGGQAITGSAGKRERLFQQAGDARYLHISCHGDFDPDTPLASSLHLAPGETLTAQEVLDGLRLNCELVTLSACESGLSTVRRGDELMGLVRAFMVAGAPAVVATLWRVDERSTRLLMERFYREMSSGAEPATALHRSQLYLRTLDSRFADPFYWAPFVLIGDAG